MKREIKFRAWDNEDKKMLKQTSTMSFNETGDKKKSSYNWEAYTRNMIEVMQFTGLQDKNGKEIYEGDIVENNDYVWEVTWKEGAVYIENRSKDKKGKWWIGGESAFSKVIGNIYENPELLN